MVGSSNMKRDMPCRPLQVIAQTEPIARFAHESFHLLDRDLSQDAVSSRTEWKTHRGEHSGSTLVCASCSHPITSEEARTHVDGANRHTFANPAGHVFTIDCFAVAPGCLIFGTETAEFSWFSGYRWSYAVCAMCASHLGWQFRGEKRSFFGLIAGALVEKGSPEK